MIARFRFLLPYAFSMLMSSELTPFEFERGPYRIRIHPPCQALLDAHDVSLTSSFPTRELLNMIAPATPQRTTDAIKINGFPTIQANLLQIDFIKEDFDRRMFANGQESESDPPITFVVEVVNEFLSTIRAITQAGSIHPITPTSLWRLRYFTDDEQELEYKEGFRRGTSTIQFSWKIVSIDTGIWDKLKQLTPGYVPPTWSILLTDATDLLPEIGTSVVLAAAALEILISTTLNFLAAQSTLPTGLWEWINDRGDYRKEPSVEEQFDKLLLFLGQKSLKSEPQLWEAFKKLKEARNSFVHKGKAYIGKQEVSQEMAYSLIASAMQIAAWVQNLLPPEQRLPAPNHQEPSTLQITKEIDAPIQNQSNV